MDRGSRILLWIFLIITTLSVAALFHKSFVTESYEQTYSEDYEPEQMGEDDAMSESDVGEVFE